MTQRSDRFGEDRYAWASSATTTPPTQAMPAGTPAFAPPAGGPAFPYAGPTVQPGPPPAHPGTPPGHSPAGPGSMPPAPPGGTGGGRRPRRSPGWPGVLAVGVGSAVLASLLTAGVLHADDETNAATSAPRSSQNGQSEQAQPGPVTGSNSQSPDWEAVAAAVEPSVVAVQVSAQGGSGEGSGVILDKDGRILTNNHVVSGGGGTSSLRVTLADGRGYTATIVGTDPSTDLAVIKIDEPPADLKPATLGNSGAVKVGDPVMAVGNPLGLAGTVTTGIVSAVDRPVTTAAEAADPTAAARETVVTNAIQTDAAVNPGNSGGALVDAQGRVVGINSSIASLGGGIGGQSGSIGLGFAIPMDQAKYVSSQLAEDGTVAHAWLGITPVDGDVTVDGARREAAVLRTINDGSPAAKAGLQDGDAVVGVDGDAVNSAASLVGQLRERRPGVVVNLEVVRDGEALDVETTLGTRPES